MSKVFLPHSQAPKVMPSIGRTLQQIAQTAGAGATWQEIARYNWATDQPHEVNRVLVELYGCTAPNTANPELSPMDPSKAPSVLPVLIPKLWKEAAIPASATHTIVVKNRRPPTAIGITKLDKWFIVQYGDGAFLEGDTGIMLHGLGTLPQPARPLPPETKHGQ